MDNQLRKKLKSMLKKQPTTIHARVVAKQNGVSSDEFNRLLEQVHDEMIEDIADKWVKRNKK